MVTNPNIGLKPARERGARAHLSVAGSLRLPPRAVLREQGPRRRRRAQLRLPQSPRLEMPSRLRFGAFGRAYLLLTPVVVAALLYLVQAAGATQASYEIGRLQAQQQDLAAEQDHLRFQEASLKSPAQIETQAAQASLARPQPYKYVTYREAAIALGNQPPPAPDRGPLWERALASLGQRVTGSQDALAAGH